MNNNRVCFAGNLTAEPAVNYSPKGTAVVNASLANNEFYTSEGSERLRLQASPGVSNARKLSVITNPDQHDNTKSTEPGGLISYKSITRPN